MKMKEYRKSTEEMLSFIEKSPTAFHAVANIKADLEEHGFRELKEAEKWELEPGKGFILRRLTVILLLSR